MTYRVLGIGAAVIDHTAFVPDITQKKLAPGKGGAIPISQRKLNELKNWLTFTSSPGGSAVNTLKGLSYQGASCTLLGKKGNDLLGNFFETSLMENKIKSNLLTSTLNTAEVIAFVTPDGDRTMRSYLGASSDFLPTDLNKSFFKGFDLVHIEGYVLYNPGTIEKAMELAKDAGAKISLNLASFEVVTAFKEKLAYLIERYVDILFASEKEAFSFTGLDAKESAVLMQKLSPIAIITQGSKGCFIASDKGIVNIPAVTTVPVLDTTGAGDYFAAGFLNSYLKGEPLDKCGERGAALAALIIQILGTNLRSIS